MPAALGQVEFSRPINFNANFVNYNAAFAGLEEQKALNIQYQSYPAPREVFKTLFLNGYSKVNDKINGGFSIVSDIQSGYSSLTGVYLLGNYQLFETSISTFQVGGTIGVVNYQLLPTPYTPGVSKWVLNLDYGMMYRHKNHLFGASLQNLINPKIQIITSLFQLPLQVGASYRYTWKANPSFELQPTGVILYNEKEKLIYAGLIEMVAYDQFVMTVGAVAPSTGLILGVGLKNLLIKDAFPCGIYFTYSENVSKYRSSLTGKYEILFKIYLN